MELKEFYTISDVATETGFSQLRIRAWENRYQLLNPQRTHTNFRRYTAADVKKLLQIKLLLQKGYKISELAGCSIAELSDLNSKGTLDFFNHPHIKPFVQCIQALDDTIFIRHYNTLRKSYSFEHIMETMLFPTLNNIHVLWYTHDLEVCKEQFLSNLVRQKIISEIGLMPRPINKKNPVLLFLPEKEPHEIGLLYIHYYLLKKKQPVIYLGSGIDVEAIKPIVKNVEPSKYITVVHSEQSLKSPTHFYQWARQAAKLAEFYIIGPRPASRSNKLLYCNSYAEVLQLLGYQ